MKLNIKQSEYNERIAKAERLPSIALFAGDKLDGPITIEVPPINKNLNYWYIGVGVKFDIASTFKSGKKIRLARLSTQRAQRKRLIVAGECADGSKSGHISVFMRLLPFAIHKRKVWNWQHKTTVW